MAEVLTVDELLKSAVRAGMSNTAMYHVAHLARIAREVERKMANLEARVAKLESVASDDGK